MNTIEFQKFQVFHIYYIENIKRKNCAEKKLLRRLRLRLVFSRWSFIFSPCIEDFKERFTMEFKNGFRVWDDEYEREHWTPDESVEV